MRRSGECMSKKNDILIVDDGKLNRALFAEILKDSYGILEAWNGKQALDILAEKKDRIALIVLDLVMPVMDGYGFLEVYGRMDEYRYIPVIVVTTNDDLENERKSLALGAWDFISKTSHADIIRFRVSNAIDKSKVRFLEYDPLTEIYNQQKFYQMTRDMLDGSENEEYAFIHFDIDRFKMINAFYGAKEGNWLICFVARAISESMEAYGSGTYGRISGDVFGICMPYQKTMEIYNLLTQIRKKLKKHPVHYYLETCAGIYLVEDRDMEVSVMNDNAALAAAQCKEQYMVHDALYTRELSDKLMREQYILDEMDTALEQEQFVIYFQPKYELERLSPYGAEALVRWQKPDGRLIPPDDFIPIFEKNGFITRLDYYVWEKVCQFISRKLQEGKEPAPISVNVSRVNLYNPKFLTMLINLVEQYKIPTKYLHLELTESAFSENEALMRDTVKYLHRAGFTILMDDFGSGYSSLNILKDVELDVLKIDMNFFSKGSTAKKGAKIIEAVIKMAESLDMTVIAEGVEEEEQVKFLKELGCDYIQGYYFAKPMPQEQYEALTNQN